MREKTIEEYLRNRAKEFNGRAYKFVSPGNSGVPDRIVMFPGGMIAFVELKAPGKKFTPLQELQQRRIREMGFQVLILDSKSAVDDFIFQCMGVK